MIKISLILAKIHMVTKHRRKKSLYWFLSYSSKNPYGNKTEFFMFLTNTLSYSSKNPYGNKTTFLYFKLPLMSYSSKNPYGNKTV